MHSITTEYVPTKHKLPHDMAMHLKLSNIPLKSDPIFSPVTKEMALHMFQTPHL